MTLARIPSNNDNPIKKQKLLHPPTTTYSGSNCSIKEGLSPDQRKSKPFPTSLTKEQRDRIEKNRLRALTIRKQRKIEKKKSSSPPGGSNPTYNYLSGDWITDSDSEPEGESLINTIRPRHVPILICQSSARERYCLPPDTLDMIPVVSTKRNEHNKKFSDVKLYDRKMLREAAYRRHGGREGLVKERKRREERKLNKLLGSVEGIFSG